MTVRRLRDAGYGWGHVFWLLLPVAGLIFLVVLLAQRSRVPEAAGAAPVLDTSSALASGTGADILGRGTP